MLDRRTEFTRLRECAGLSIEEAAQLLHVTERTIRRYETPGSRGTDPSPLAMDFVRRMAQAAARANFVDREKPAFRFIDLFAGIGGLRRPFEEIGGKCVFTAEWDRWSRKTYAANYPDNPFDHEFAGDIRPYADEPWKVPKHDVLLAGFPCQPFSIAGVSKKNALGRPHGFLCDTQGTLFYDLAKIIAHHQPKAFLLENVKNLERHDRGRTFATIMHVLTQELGYKVQYRVISSAPWVPQKRERVFIVGFREETGFSFDDLELPESREPVLGDILEDDVDAKYTLSEHLWGYLQGYKEKHAKKGNGFGYSVCDFIIPVSDTQAYRQFGNAVVVPVVARWLGSWPPILWASPL